MKSLFLTIAALFYLGLIGSFAFTFEGGPPPEDPCGCDTWYRSWEWCPNAPNKIEYHCSSGGEEVCQITHC